MTNERTMVLRMLKDGRIGVEEAEALLAVLDEEPDAIVRDGDAESAGSSSPADEVDTAAGVPTDERTIEPPQRESGDPPVGACDTGNAEIDASADTPRSAAKPHSVVDAASGARADETATEDAGPGAQIDEDAAEDASGAHAASASAGDAAPGAHADKGSTGGAGEEDENGNRAGFRSEGFSFGFDFSKIGHTIRQSLADVPSIIRQALSEVDRDEIVRNLKSAARLPRVQRRFAHTFDATDLQELRIVVPRGDVSVRAAHGQTALVDAQVTAWVQNVDPDQTDHEPAWASPVSAIGDRIVVDGQSIRNDRRVTDIRIDIDAEIPPQMRLTVEAGSGAVAVTGTASDTVIRTGSGEVSVDDASATVDIKVGSGDVSVSRHVGTLTVRSGSGDVDIESRGSRVDVTTGSGDANTRFEAQHGGAYRVQTGSGDIVVAVSGGATISASTKSGSVTIPGMGRNGGKLTVGDGSSAVELTSGSGDIAVDAEA